MSISITDPKLQTLYLRNGTLVNERYEVKNFMCRTKLAQVYKVTDKKKGDTVCVLKLLAINNKSFSLESHYLKLCSGERGFPLFVESFDFNKDGDEYKCIVTSYEGETLFLHLTRRQFEISIANTLRIGYKLFCLLEKMHQRGYVHRDVQFSNILVEVNYGGDIDVKLIDFGSTVKRTPTPQSIGITGWHVSFDVINGKPYTVFDDLTSLVSTLMACQGINPFGYLKEHNLELKKQFHHYPMRHFHKLETQWIGQLYLEINRQRTAGFNKSAILEIFKNAVKGVSPQSPITYSFTNGRVFID